MASNSERLLENRWAAPAWMRPMLSEAAEEIERLRLTDVEREAVDTAEASLMRESTNRNTPEPVRQRFGAAVNTLRGLLARLK